MTTKILNGIYSAAYNLTSPITTLSITASGYLADGLVAAGAGTYTIVNNGVIHGSANAVSIAGAGFVTNLGTIQSTVMTGRGIILGNGGVVTNGGAGALRALIAGYYGIKIDGSPGSVINSGTILAGGKYGVLLTDGGAVSNGVGGAINATIEGTRAIEVTLGGTVQNYGTVLGRGTLGLGVFLSTGGSVTNGSATNTSANIVSGNVAVVVSGAAGTVTNFGLMAARGPGGTAGVDLTDGGSVTNGSTSDTAASIQGPNAAVSVAGSSGTVNNFATIGDLAGLTGIYLSEGGAVTNGGASDTAARIAGGNRGLKVMGQSGTVKNFGTILSDLADITSVGLDLDAGGIVTNGSAGDTTACIRGGNKGLSAQAIAATVTNFGTIDGPSAGVVLAAGGRVTNGTATDTGALIYGRYGVFVGGPSAGTLTNYGAIRGALFGGVGVFLNSGGRVTNGSSADKTALITGGIGVSMELVPGTVINNGTISGVESANGLGLNLARGSATNGSATNATALITGYTGVSLGSGTTLTNFGTVQAGGSNQAVLFTTSTGRLNAEAGSVILGSIVDTSGGTVDVVSGVAVVTGLVTAGQLIGAGTLKLTGSSTFYSGTSLAAAEIQLTGGAYVLGTLVDSRIWDQSSGSLGIHAFDQMTFSGLGDSFSGSIYGAGAVVLNGGSDTLSNVAISTAQTTMFNAAVTFSGSIGMTSKVSATGANLVVAAGGATFSGGGTISLSNVATNSLHGASSTATLTNGDFIRGAGHLGGGVMTLVNGASGIIEGVGSAGLIIDTGANTISNAGTIEALSGNVTTIASALANNGLLAAAGGTLTVNGAVAGTGQVKVNGGMASFASTFNEAVTFGPSGALTLANSQTYTASIVGFSFSGTTSLDLRDINAATATSSFSGTTTAGVLTVTDGTHSAHIHFTGNYTTSTWTLSNDGSGGTVVVDPNRAKTASQVHALIAAAASLSPAVGMDRVGAGVWQSSPPLLAIPQIRMC